MSSTDNRRIRTFNRICAILALLLLSALVFEKLFRYHRQGLPNVQDYPQYYMGGVIAVNGEFDSLYPIPTNNAFANPGAPENSEMRPRYAELAEERGVGNEVRYMQPPPFALLLAPLGLFSYWHAQILWTALLVLAGWGVGIQAGRIFELCAGKPSRFSGILILFICISPQAFRWARVGNMSVMLGFLIGWAMIDLALRRAGVRAAIPIVIGALAKYITLVLFPLYLAMRQWRTIVWTLGLGALSLFITFAVMGAGPFEVFFGEISPTLARTTGAHDNNNALHAFLLRIFGMSDTGPVLNAPWEKIFRIFQMLVLLLIAGLILTRRRDHWQHPSHVFAAGLALIAWMVIFSPIFWEHYHAYFAPMWGWLIWEATRGKGRAIVVTLAIGMAYMPTQLIKNPPARVLETLKNLGLAASRPDGTFRLPEPLFSHLLWSAVLMLALAMWVTWKPTLTSSSRESDKSPTPTPPPPRPSES